MLIRIFLFLCFAFAAIQAASFHGRFPQETDNEIQDEYYDDLIRLLSRKRKHTQCSSTSTSPHSVKNWPNDTKVANLGGVGGLSVDTQGNVAIFHRGSHVWDGRTFDMFNVYQHQDEGAINVPTIYILDPETGKVLQEYGKDLFYMPHGITIDTENNFWITDVALHQVFKFPSDFSEPELILGQRFKPGPQEDRFCKPTDVAVSLNGDFFVGDGYCNSRILHFSQTGELKNIIGQSRFNIIHSLALDDENGYLFGADRENSQIHVFNVDTGAHSYSISTKEQGRIYAITFAGNALYGVVVGSVSQGITVDLKENKVVDVWESNQNFSIPHDIAIDQNCKNLYVGKIPPNQGVVKLSLT